MRTARIERCHGHRHARAVHANATGRIPRRAALALVATISAGSMAVEPAHADECDLTTAPSGLQFCELAEGSGAAAEPDVRHVDVLQNK